MKMDRTTYNCPVCYFLANFPIVIICKHPYNRKGQCAYFQGQQKGEEA